MTEFSLLIQTGSEENFFRLLNSVVLRQRDLPYPEIHVSASFPCPRPYLQDWLIHPEWNPSRIWNTLRRGVPKDRTVILCSDDVVFMKDDDLHTLAALAEESDSAVHASIVGNVINLPVLSSPYPTPQGEFVAVRKGTDIPLICVALPPRWSTKFDESYMGYGRDDHDFWEASLRAGRRINVSRKVIVAHDDDRFGTGRSVGRRPGGWADNWVQVRRNDARFLSKWGYL